MKNSAIIPLVVALVVGAAAFFGGMKYQESKASNTPRQFQGGQGGVGRQGGSGRGNGGRPVVGEILSQDDKSITVKLQDGSSKIVLLPDSVSVTKTDQGSKSDLKIGMRVGVFGTDNSDGSVTAQNVQLNPMFRGIPGGQPSPAK